MMNINKLFVNKQYLKHKITMKNWVANHLVKWNRKSRNKHFPMYRFLFSLIQNNEKTEYVSSKIGEWLLGQDAKISNSLYYKLTDFWVVDNTIYLYTYFPGLWIGKGGETVNSLLNEINNTTEIGKSLGLRQFNYKIEIIEENNSSVDSMRLYMKWVSNNY